MEVSVRTINRDIEKLSEARFDYMKQGEISNRKVRPRKLVFRAQSWYLYAFCEERQDFRYFKFHRMRHLEVTNERFDPLSTSKEKPSYYVNQKKTFQAIVAIDKCMAYRAFDEMNPSCVIEDDDRFIFTIADAEESWFFGYILSYGQYAQVLSPADARENMIHMIETMAENYDAGDGA